MKVTQDFKFPKTLSPRYRQQIRRTVSHTLKLLPKKTFLQFRKNRSYSLSVSIITDAQMKRLNANFRGKNRPTDVLAFSRQEGLQLPSAFPEIGDVVISLPTARRQASEFGCSLDMELARLTVHGILHLFGYDHEKSKREEKRMFRLQAQILNSLFSNGFDGI